MKALVRVETKKLARIELEDAAAAAVAFARASKAPSTLHSYQADWRAFTAWCSKHKIEPLPALPTTVAAYLSYLAKRLRPSSISRQLAAIRFFHKAAGFDSPVGAEAVKAVHAGIRRTLGTAAVRKAPATAEAIAAMIDGIEGQGLKGLRDRAMLLLGFAAALRRSELVALDVHDIEETPEGLLVNIRRSKTDQEGSGELVSVPRGRRLQPVKALRAWLKAAKITRGPIFRAIGKGGRVAARRLTPHSVALIVKARAKAAGFDPASFSGHSLRAGFVTSALSAGADLLRVMDVTRHREVKTLKGYDRRARAFKDHAGGTFL